MDNFNFTYLLISCTSQICFNYQLSVCALYNFCVCLIAAKFGNSIRTWKAKGGGGPMSMSLTI